MRCHFRETVKDLNPIMDGLESTAIDPKNPDASRTLSPEEMTVVLLHFQSRTTEEIATVLHIDPEDVTGILERPAVKAKLRTIDEKITEKITKGDFGVAAVFKSSAPGAARRIVGMSKRAREERTKLQANKDVLNYAGYERPRMVHITVEHIFDQMSVEELDSYAVTGEIPNRFEGQLGQMGVIQKQIPHQPREDPPQPVDWTD